MIRNSIFILSHQDDEFGLFNIKAINYRDLLVADKSRDFTAMVISLLQSKIKNKYIACNGRAYVAKFHNWHDINSKSCKIIAKKLN